MGRIEFKSNNVVTNKGSELGNIPKVRLKQNQVARIAVLEDPVAEWQHRLEAPQIKDGVPQYESKKIRGAERTVNVMDWKSSPRCLGDDLILSESGLDPANCPMCAEAKKSDKVRAPQRRFAVNVLEYNTKPGGSQLTDTFMVTCKVWTFNDRRFSVLVDLHNEHGPLTGYDLILGPCTVESFQNYEVRNASQAAWASGAKEAKAKGEPIPMHTQLATQVWASRQNEKTLHDMCAPVKELKYIEMDLDDIHQAWDAVKAYESEGAPVPSGGMKAASPQMDSYTSASLASGLDDLLGGSPSATPAPSYGTPTSDGLDDLLGGGTADPNNPHQGTPSAHSADQGVPSAGGVDMSDLMSDSSSSGASTADLLDDPAPKQESKKDEPLSFEDLLGSV